MTIDLAAFERETVALWRQPVADRWSPQWAKHVVGLFGPLVTDDGVRQPIPYRIICMTCGAEHRGECATGAVRSHVAHFGMAHLHRDPFATRR